MVKRKRVRIQTAQAQSFSVFSGKGRPCLSFSPKLRSQLQVFFTKMEACGHGVVGISNGVGIGRARALDLELDSEGREGDVHLMYIGHHHYSRHLGNICWLKAVAILLWCRSMHRMSSKSSAGMAQGVWLKGRVHVSKRCGDPISNPQ